MGTMPDLVALALPGGPAFVEELQRIWSHGDAVFPVDLRLPKPLLDAQLTSLRPARIVDAGGSAKLANPLPVEPGDALVMATSGTTGTAKGVVLTHDAVQASARASSSYLAIDPGRHHWLCCLPVAHVAGLGVITRALYAGTALTVVAGFDAADVTEAARSGVTHTSLVVTAYQRIDPSLFEKILLGGSAIPSGRPAHVIATYGLTETGSGCVYDGWPLEGVELAVDDNGQIRLRGPMLLRAYRDGTDPKDRDGWFPTGDVGELAPDGQLRMFGRAGDLIITGGQNVFPDPVEAVLATVTGVREVAVVGRPDPEWGHAVTAVVVPTDTSDLPPLEALREAVRARLAPYCAPRRVEYVVELPRTALGKVQRQRL